MVIAPLPFTSQHHSKNEYGNGEKDEANLQNPAPRVRGDAE
jgi:hypothetical protein